MKDSHHKIGLLAIAGIGVFVAGVTAYIAWDNHRGKAQQDEITALDKSIKELTLYKMQKTA